MAAQYKAEILHQTDFGSSWVGVGSVRSTYGGAKNDLSLFFKHNAEWGNWKVDRTRILYRDDSWKTITEEDVNDVHYRSKPGWREAANT